MEDLMKLDLYAILGVASTAETKDIKKAYRQSALKCHPDKNPDDQNAAKIFHQLTRALEVLIDAKARAAYDKVLKAREAVKLRNEVLDSRRKKLKEDLEEKERLAEQSSARHTAEEQLQREIERLRKQGSKDVEEEAARVRQKLAESLNERLYSLRRVQIRWKADKKDPGNGGYSEKNLTEIFSKYGDIEALVVSRKNGSALVEFKSPEAAKRATWLEIGYVSNPLKLKILGAPAETPVTQPSGTSNNVNCSSSNLFPCFTAAESKPASHLRAADLDAFEEYVMRGLSEAQARKNAAKNAEPEVL